MGYKKETVFASRPITRTPAFVTTIAGDEYEIVKTNLQYRPFEARRNGRSIFSGYLTPDGKTIEFYQKHTYTVVARFDAETFERVIDLNDFPVPVPASAQDEADGAGATPSAYEIACMAVVAAEDRYQREYSNPNSVNFTDAILALQNAKLARAQAARDEIKARVYPVRRTAVADSATVLMTACDALARIADEWIASIHDSAEDDAALRAGLPVRTIEATYHAVL